MKPDFSLLFPQEPTIGPCPEPNESSPHPHAIFIFKMYYNIILPSTLMSPKSFLPLKFCDWNFVHSFCFPSLLHSQTISPTLILSVTLFHKQSSPWDFLQPPTTSSLLGPNNVPSTLRQTRTAGIWWWVMVSFFPSLHLACHWRPTHLPIQWMSGTSGDKMVRVWCWTSTSI
jgi:hypothetical protein